MAEEKKEGFNIKYLIIGIGFSLLCLGIVDHVWNIDDNLCEMTYMYEHPQYIPIPVPGPLKNSFPRYNLFVYGEGTQAKTFYEGDYTGQPVLFIPGNGGSYKQVRSLASVAYRKSLEDAKNGEMGPHYDFFTADLAEDLGGLYGPALDEQTKFIAAIIPVIQQLYLQSKPIILVGHSMGGMVARAVLMTASEPVPLIVTLATPHTAPPVALDPYISGFYDKVNSYWTLEQVSEGELSNTTLVSIGGGRNDILVSPLSVLTSHAHVISTTTAVPGCWATTDHLSVVWCKQLVMAVVRALHDSLDSKTGLVHLNRRRVHAVFNYHLVSRHSGKRFSSPKQNAQIKIDPEGAVYNEVIKRQFSLDVPKDSAHTYVMIPLTGQPKKEYYSTTIKVTGIEEKNWVFACAAVPIEGYSKACKSGLNLSKHGKLLGGTKRRSKIVELIMRPLLEEGYTHLVVSVPPSSRKATVMFDVHGEHNRRATIATPRLVSSFKPTQAIEVTPKNALTQKLILEGLNEPWHSYDLLIVSKTSGCSFNYSRPQVLVPYHTSTQVAHAHHRTDGTHHIFKLEQDEVFRNSKEKMDMEVELVLQPQCAYSVSIKANLAGAFRRIFVLYGSQLPAFVVCQLLLGISVQLKSINKSRYCPSLLSSLLSLTPIVVVPFVKIFALLLQKIEYPNDQQQLTESGIDVPILPILLFFCCLPITLLLSGTVWVIVLVAGSTLHSTALRVFGASVGATETVVDLAFTGLSKVPAVVAISLLAIAFGSCGALAMALATIFYFMFLFDMYKDHIRKVILKLIPKLQDESPPVEAPADNSGTDSSSTPNSAASSNQGSTSTTNAAASSSTSSTGSAGIVVTRVHVPQSSESLALHLHLSLLIMCIVISLLQVPSLIAWAIHAKYSGGSNASLPADPSLLPSSICLLSLAVLWQMNPLHERQGYVAVGWVLHGLAIISLVFAALSVYRLPYLIAGALAAAAIHQLFAPKTE